MKNNILIYGFTGHQTVLLSPLIRRIWTEANLHRIDSLRNIETLMQTNNVLFCNGENAFYELAPILRTTEVNRRIQVVCTAWNAISPETLRYLLKYPSLMLLFDMEDETEITACCSAVQAGRTFRTANTFREQNRISTEPREAYDRLSLFEQYAVMFMMRGLTPKDLANDRGIAISTAKTFWQRALKKHNVHSAIELVRLYG